MSEERKPLLSDERLDTMSGHGEMTAWEKYVGEAVRDFYENLITTGKLRVVEEVELDWGGGFSAMCKCGHVYFSDDYINHCPRCGSKIKQ